MRPDPNGMGRHPPRGGELRGCTLWGKEEREDADDCDYEPKGRMRQDHYRD